MCIRDRSSPGPCLPSKRPSPACCAASPQVRKSRPDFAGALGPTGFGLARQLTAAGIRCVVAAPSKLQRPPGDRVKTDSRDAQHLAKLLRMDQIVEVRVPSVEQEAARDLVRAREDVRGDLMRSRHRVSKLLLRQGILYSGGHPWTGVHEQWLRVQHFALPGLQLAFDSAFETVLLTAALSLIHISEP